MQRICIQLFLLLPPLHMIVIANNSIIMTAAWTRIQRHTLHAAAACVCVCVCVCVCEGRGGRVTLLLLSLLLREAVAARHVMRMGDNNIGGAGCERIATRTIPIP